MDRSRICLTIAALVLLPCAAARAQSIFVTTPMDVVDFSGAQTTASLPGPDGLVSMREACIAANNTAGPQTIGFQVPAGAWGTSTKGPVILNLGLSFPIDDDATTVDGTTQTAFTGDTNPGGAEVFFHSIVIDPPLITSGTIAVSSDGNVFLGLGNMSGRNYGIDLLPTAEENTVRACTINAVFAAVRVQGDRNVVGSDAPGLGNVLSSLSDGVRIQGLDGETAQDNRVIGNTLTGGFNGVQLTGAATGNSIGGLQPGEGNVIARAGYLQEDGTPDGAMVRIESDGNAVLGNLVGTNAAGTAAADNLGDVGIEIYGDDNLVQGNVVGGITGLTGFLSVQAGIHLREGAEDNRIEGNWIGVDPTGTIPLPNHVGILISAFDSSLPMPGGNSIGTALGGSGNVIAHNEAGGIRVLLDSVGNRFMGNEIRDNHAAGGLGIDLGGDGPTPNDHGDVDSGPNLLMNAPVLHTAVAGAGAVVVTGRVVATDPVGTLLEFFLNPAPAPGEVVEAAEPVGLWTVGALDGRFVAVLSVPDGTGLALTAIATDEDGNSSEVSTPVLITASPWTDLGFGVDGTYGVPLLLGAGPLLPGQDAGLLLHAALENSTGFWIIGASAVFAPAGGGTLVPAPQFLVPLSTGDSTSSGLVATWPAGVPSGATIVAQAWIVDPSGVQGFAASNGVQGTAP